MKIARWSEIPDAIRAHLETRLYSRGITTSDLEKLRAWRETSPEVPATDWYKDFGSFILCGRAEFPKTFLTPDQKPYGIRL